MSTDLAGNASRIQTDTIYHQHYILLMYYMLWLTYIFVKCKVG